MLTEGRVGVVDVAPPRPVLIFDGSCSFCLRWIGRVRRWDRRGVVDYVPLQDERAPRLTGRPRETLRQAVHLVRTDRVVFAGAAAARELFALLPFGRILYVALRLPGVRLGAARCYAWVARRWGPVT